MPSFGKNTGKSGKKKKSGARRENDGDKYNLDKYAVDENEEED